MKLLPNRTDATKTKIIKAAVLPLFVLLLLVLPQFAFAESSSLPYSLFPFTTFTPKPTDLSVGFLAQMFGNVTGVIQTGQQTILGQIFYVFNSGMLIFAGIFIIYTVFKTVIEINHPHEQMQKKFSYWQAIRVALGIGLITPQASGYSLLNSIVMWITIQGVGLADMVWDQAVNYLKQGGIMTTAAVASTTTVPTPVALFYQTTGTYSSAAAGSSGSSDILRALVCMYSVQYAQQDYITKHMPDSTTQVSLAPSFDSNPNDLIHTPAVISFPGSYVAVDTSKQLKGVCGQFVWNAPPQVAMTPTSDQNGLTQYITQKQIGAQQMIAELDSIAQIIAQTSNDQSITNNNDLINYLNTLAEVTANAMVTAGADYQASIYPAMVYANQGFAPTETIENQQGNALSTINTDEGWIQAGRYYFDMINLANMSKAGTIDEDKSIELAAYMQVNASPYILPASFGTNRTSDNENFDSFITDSARKNNLQQTLQWINTAEWGVGPYPIGSVTKNCGNGVDINSVAMCIIAQLDQLANNVSQALTTPEAMQDEISQSTGEKGARGAAGAVKGAADVASNGVALFLPNVLSGYINSQSINVGFPLLAIGFTMSNIVFIPLNIAINKVAGKWMEQMATQENAAVAPVIKLQNLGMQMITSTVTMWKTLLDTLGIMTAAYFIGSSIAQIVLQVATGAANSLLGILMGTQMAAQSLYNIINEGFALLVIVPVMMAIPIALAVSMLFLTMGAILAYYIPLVPFMLFLFGTITWLICVIEAMAMSPLFGVMMIYPEGEHDIFGKGIHGIWILLSIFLRPVFLVVGLVCAIILTYVALNILNVGFSGILSDLFYAASSPSTGNKIKMWANGDSAVNSITAVAMMLIYLWIVLAIYNQCNSVITTLVNRVMGYFGVSVQGGGEEQMLAGVKEGFGSQVSQLGQSAGSAIQGAQFKHPSISMKPPSGKMPEMGAKPPAGGGKEGVDLKGGTP